MADRRISRRALLGGAAGGAAATALSGVPYAAAAPSGSRTRSADVVIVGAGLAGLTAADALARRGRSVLVLEADDRVGGRILGEPIGGGDFVEMGGEFIGPTQNRIAALANRLGVRTFPTYLRGDNVYHRLGTRRRYPKDVPLPPDSGAAEAAKAIVQLDQMASEVPTENPWRAPRAREYDSKTFQTWIEENLQTPGGRFLATLATRAIFSCEPRDTSLLFVLFYIAAAGNERNEGNLERLVATEDGAQERRFVGGSQRIPEKLARQLGSRVVLGAPVNRIVQSGGGVRVEAEGLTAVGREVIVAIPPTLSGRIDYRPKLPADRDQLTQRYPMGSVIKVNVVYDRPFWRDRGLTGSALGDLSPLQVTFDNTPPDGRPGVLMGFIEASEARRLDRRSAEERKRGVIDNLAKYFGSQARRPRRYIEKLWDEDAWHRGCPVGIPSTGTLLEYGPAIRRPVGRVHWAGTETATFWNGYMDGAVRSGERAAGEVLRALSRGGGAPPPGGSRGSRGGQGEICQENTRGDADCRIEQ